MKNYIEMKQELHKKVLEVLDYGRELSDEEVLDVIDEVLLEEQLLRLMPVNISCKLRQDLFYSLRRLDILQNLLEDSSITEIMINGYANIFIEKNGEMIRLENGFDSEEKLQDVIQQIVAGCNRVVNEASPIVDARLSNGARVNVVMSPVALNGPIVTIRRFPDKAITMEDLIAKETISKEVAALLKQLVEARYNILVSGGTGTGKTTFLNVLSGFIPSKERIVTIEDSAELQLQGIPNLVRLETRNSNVEGLKEISIRDLIKTSLRMRPDRIVVGEVRGGEAVDMMQCMNTGHDGSMSTAHANSAKDLLARLENMIAMGMEIPLSAIRKQIASGVDIMVHLDRRKDGSRKVVEIVEVLDSDGETYQLNSLYQYKDGTAWETGQLVKVGELIHEDKLRKAYLL